MSSDRYNSSQFSNIDNSGQGINSRHRNSSSSNNPNWRTATKRFIKQQEEKTSVYRDVKKYTSDGVSKLSPTYYPPTSLYERGFGEMLFDPNRSEKLIKEYVDRILFPAKEGIILPNDRDEEGYYLIDQMWKDKRLSNELRVEITRQIAVFDVGLSHLDFENSLYKRICAAVEKYIIFTDSEVTKDIYLDILDRMNYPALCSVLGSLKLDKFKEAIPAIEKLYNSSSDDYIVCSCVNNLRFLYVRYSPSKLPLLEIFRDRIDPETIR